jgi:hypothetical protein
VGESLAVRHKSNDEGIEQRPPQKAAATKNGTIVRVNEVLSAFAERDYDGEVLTAVRKFPARAAQSAEWPEWVRAELRAAYASKGIARPYSHQAAAAEVVHAGKNVVIVTPTASGKTLCYNLPVINAILENEDTRALYLFPTKALAQDQLAELYDVNQRLEAIFEEAADEPAEAIPRGLKPANFRLENVGPEGPTSKDQDRRPQTGSTAGAEKKWAPRPVFEEAAATTVEPKAERDRTIRGNADGPGSAAIWGVYL